jgi:hypothetical protein
MENNILFIEPLVARAEQYGKLSYELIKLKAIHTLSKVVSTFISRVILILVLAMAIIVLTIGVALWLGDLLGKSYYGFFCVAGFYCIIGFVLYFFLHHKIKKAVSNSIILQILN